MVLEKVDSLAKVEQETKDQVNTLEEDLAFGFSPAVEASPPHKPLKCAGYMIAVDTDVEPYGSAILSVTPSTQ